MRPIHGTTTGDDGKKKRREGPLEGRGGPGGDQGALPSDIDAPDKLTSTGKSTIAGEGTIGREAGPGPGGYAALATI